MVEVFVKEVVRLHGVQDLLLRIETRYFESILDKDLQTSGNATKIQHRLPSIDGWPNGSHEYVFGAISALPYF